LTPKQKALVIDLYEHEQDIKGAELMGWTPKKFKMYGRRWKEKRDSAQAQAQEAPLKNPANDPFNTTVVRDGKKVTR
jgi:hypothetical protein